LDGLTILNRPGRNYRLFLQHVPSKNRFHGHTQKTAATSQDSDALGPPASGHGEASGGFHSRPLPEAAREESHGKD